MWCHRDCWEGFCPCISFTIDRHSVTKQVSRWRTRWTLCNEQISVSNAWWYMFYISMHVQYPIKWNSDQLHHKHHFILSTTVMLLNKKKKSLVVLLHLRLLLVHFHCLKWKILTWTRSWILDLLLSIKLCYYCTIQTRVS